MLFLLKAELSYYKWLYVLCILITLLLNIALTADGKWIEAQGDFPGLRVIWLGIGIIVLFFTILFNKKNGRLRLQTSLPMSNFKLAIIRWIPFMLFWLALIFILIVFYILNYKAAPDSQWSSNLISISGIIILINSVPILYSDLYSTYYKNSEKIIMISIWSILWIVYITINIIFSTYFDELSPNFFVSTRHSITEIYTSLEITLINLLLGLLLFFITILSFKRRKLYFE